MAVHVHLKLLQSLALVVTYVTGGDIEPGVVGIVVVVCPISCDATFHLPRILLLLVVVAKDLQQLFLHRNFGYS